MPQASPKRQAASSSAALGTAHPASVSICLNMSTKLVPLIPGSPGFCLMLSFPLSSLPYVVVSFVHLACLFVIVFVAALFNAHTHVNFLRPLFIGKSDFNMVSKPRFKTCFCNGPTRLKALMDTLWGFKALCV